MTSESVNNMNLVNCGKRAPDQSITTPEKSSATPPAHSKFRGVTKNRWTDRYQARLWDGTWKKQGAKRNGKPVYLGAYDSAERAAKAYDVAAIKFWGLTAKTNFPGRDYEKEMKEMEHMTNEELVGKLRRTSLRFCGGTSKYRGVTRRHGKWQARIGKGAHNKEMHLGSFNTEEEAVVAYDTAALKHWGRTSWLPLISTSRITISIKFDVRSYVIQSGRSILVLPLPASPKAPAHINSIHTFMRTISATMLPDNSNKWPCIYSICLHFCMMTSHILHFAYNHWCLVLTFIGGLCLLGLYSVF